ncbi:MAG: serine protease [Microcoleaceae cyanobacterium MO_207.B10]|nr:serine protease [Microcoleaceae cyanobacterium MO_207.B10]
MKFLPRILGLTFLALTLTNCSGKLPPEKIASRLEPSIVKLFYKNQPGHGTGFFVSGEKGVCSVLTAAHVVKKEGERLLQTRDEKVWQVARVEIFPSDIDLALVTFQPERGSCNYPALKIGNSESLKKGSSIYISGFPIRGGKLVSQFVSGDVSGLDKLARGYGVAYQALTVGGMSGAPVMDVNGKVVAVHGMSDVEVVQNFASLQGSLSESERQTFQEALERVENGVQRLTFSWGIPINLFREYRGRAIALGGEKQEVNLQQQLEEERRKREEAERRLRELEAERQKQLQDQPILDEAQTLALAGEIDRAIAKAQEIKPGRVLYDQARSKIEEWQSQQQAERNLENARQAAVAATPDAYAKAISLAQQIPTSSSRQWEATQLINQWSKQILSIAMEEVNRDVSGAIEIARKIPENSIAYNQAQGQIRIWQSWLSPD